MALQQIRNNFFLSDDINQAEITQKDIRLGYVIKPRFRFGVGDRFQIRYSIGRHDFELWINNKVSVSENDDISTIIGKHGGRIPDLHSDVLIILNTVKLPGDDINLLRTATPSDELVQVKDDFKHQRYILSGINAFIMAHEFLLEKTIIGKEEQTKIRFPDIFEYLRRKVVIAGNSTMRVSWENALEVMYGSSKEHFCGGGGFVGNLKNIPQHKLDNVSETIERQSNYVFYEFAFEAGEKIFNDDITGGLLLAVAALEGAHGAFIYEMIRAKMPADADKNLADDYIRELGMSLCNMINPYIFMEESKRPSLELLKKTGLALTYRNEIMHAIRNARGEYRSKNRTQKELYDAYYAVKKVYDIYRAELEKLLEKEKT
ncbi:MAG: hypothetical protein E3J72_12030 [Planctomycetota bacterium]|nr:MAG: hypothetical protein E3J72_12030 [Planctomycetota bacterium]